MDSAYRGKQRWHSDCIYNYKQMAKRWSGKSHLKNAWSQKSGDEKAKWFKTQRDLKQRGMKRTYDDLEVALEGSKEVYTEEAAMDDYLTYEEFSIRGRLLGKSSDEISFDWDEAVLDDTRAKKFKNGHTLVHVFRGVSERVGHKESMRTIERQSTKAPDAERATSLRKTSSDQMSRWADNLGNRSSVLSSASSASRHVETVPQHMVVSPSVPQPLNVASELFLREAHHRQQHAQYIAELEAREEEDAMDRMAAEKESQRDKRSSDKPSGSNDLSALRTSLAAKLSALRESLGVAEANLQSDLELVEKEVANALPRIVSGDRQEMHCV